MDASPLASPAVDPPSVVVALSGLDRSVLAALTYGRSISTDVKAVHVESDELASRRIRDWWRRHVHEISLEGVSARGSFADDVARYLDERGEGNADRPVLVVVPAVTTRRWVLAPLQNWKWFSITRRLARRPWTSVVAVPYRV